MRFVRGYALVHLLSPVDMSSGGLHISPTVFSVALFGVGWQGSFSSHIFPDVSIKVGYLPSLGSFIFIRWVSNTLAFQQNIDDSDPFFTIPILIFLMYNIFRRRIRSCQKNFWPFPPELVVCSVQSPWGSPLLSPGFWSSDRFSGGVSAGSCLSLSSFFIGGYLKFSEGLLRSCKLCHGKVSPWLLFALSLDGEVFNRLRPFSLTGFLV